MDNNILAKVDNLEITKQHMVNIIRTLPQQQAMEMSTIEGAKRLLNEMIAGELLYLDALELKFDEDEEFKKILDDAKHGLLQRYAIQKLFQDTEATEQELKEYYNNNKDKFNVSDQVRARHILVEDEKNLDKIKNEINNGLDFSQAAKKYSACPSKERGGDLGTFDKGKMVPEFEKAAFALKVGEISDWVKTAFGYHLIIVDEKLPASKRSFDEAKSDILKSVIEEKQVRIYDDKLKELKERYKIEINEDALR